MEHCSTGQSAVVSAGKLLLRPAICKFDCSVVPQNFPRLATAHDCGSGLYNTKEGKDKDGMTAMNIVELVS